MFLAINNLFSMKKREQSFLSFLSHYIWQLRFSKTRDGRRNNFRKVRIHNLAIHFKLQAVKHRKVALFPVKSSFSYLNNHIHMIDSQYLTTITKHVLRLLYPIFIFFSGIQRNLVSPFQIEQLLWTIFECVERDGLRLIKLLNLFIQLIHQSLRM